LQRRELLAAACVVGVVGLGGCTGSQSSPEEGADPRSTATETVSPTATGSATPTSTRTETPVPFPESCERMPDIEGLPAPPSDLTADSAEAFARDFERVYAVATNEEYGGVESLRTRSVETSGERYVVGLGFDAAPATSTADGDGGTQTPLPTDAYTHRAVYRLTETRMLREERSHIDGSLLARTCWTLERG
jgi:hypothetical protein